MECTARYPGVWLSCGPNARDLFTCGVITHTIEVCGELTEKHDGSVGCGRAIVYVSAMASVFGTEVQKNHARWRKRV
jgi:hypothetical protein